MVELQEKEKQKDDKADTEKYNDLDRIIMYASLLHKNKDFIIVLKMNVVEDRITGARVLEPEYIESRKAV